ncbi:MAG: ATP-binding protein, partial [Microcystaceae cyanobacterium]
LWQNLAAQTGKNVVLLTDSSLLTDPSDLNTVDLKESPQQTEVFYLLLSPYGNALLRGNVQLFPDYQVQLVLDNEAIAAFMAENNLDYPIPKPVTLASKKSQNFQNQLTLGILEILSPEQPEHLDQTIANCPLNSTLLQTDQARLLSQVIAQIRQSLDLSVILETAVKQVQSYLQVDRLVIYKFAVQSDSIPMTCGKITYEARKSADVSSILNLVTENDCFPEVLSYQKKYLQGKVKAICDTEITYSSSRCLIDLLDKYQIKATVIAPIIVDQCLWGLLIGHQCQTRQWLDHEQNFLGQIAEHLAIAIKQAQLYVEVQNQKNSFEKRVIERTQDLKDTLLASQAASHLKSEFIDNISHELRTPLTCIIGLSGTLLHWFNQGSTLPIDKQQHYLKIIQESGKRLMDLINDIIELSQLESGKSALNFQIFSILNLAQDVLHQLEETAQEKQIVLKLDFQIHSEQDSFCADPERIRQILIHLLSNALKFTPKEGSVILRIWKENKQAIFQVEDTGIGIAKNQFPHLFEAFKQSGENPQRTSESTGLGLALTKQLVELHTGTIEVESTKGKGSLFTVFIPHQNASHLKPEQDKSDDLANLSINISVVVIEQNEEVATLICELLTAANYQVIWLIDTANAVKQIELLQPGIVLIDQNLNDV